MRLSGIRLWLVLLLLSGVGAVGCHHTTVSGEPYIAEDLGDVEPPRTIAVLPTTDKTDHPELATRMRIALYSAITRLPYQDIELGMVDAQLARIASKLEVPPEELPESARALPSVADLVVFSQLEHVGRFYILLYGHTRIDLNLALVDTRSRKILYRNRFIIHDRIGGASVSLIGLAESMLLTLWHLRPVEMGNALERSAVKIAEALPETPMYAAASSQLRLAGVEIDLPSQTLNAGDVVRIVASGTPRCQASFSIGTLTDDTPMVETAPGLYIGRYEIQPGDDTPYAVVSVQLSDPDQRETLSFTADEQSFAVDTNPPPRARIVRYWPADDNQGIFLEIKPRRELGAKEASSFTFHVYRRRQNGALEDLGNFVNIGSSDSLVFHDQTVEMPGAYEYYIRAEDSAGNLSRPGQITSLKLQ